MTKYGDVRQALETAELESARELLREYLEAEPDSAEVWYLAAQAAVNDKQRRHFLEKAVECDPLYAAAGNELYAMLHAEADVELKARPTPKPTPQYIYAPFFNRAVAFVLDAIVLIFLTFILANVAGLLTGSPSTSQAAAQFMMVWMLMTTVTYVGYFGYCFTEWHGQTIGKRMMGVRVVKINGTSLSWSDAFLRCWVGYLLALAPLGLGFWWALFDKEKRGWHDMIAETRVVKA